MTAYPVFDEPNSPEISWQRIAALYSALQNGFRVRYRSSDFKYDEKDAIFLLDMLVDPSSGLKVGQDISITGFPFPLVFSGNFNVLIADMDSDDKHYVFENRTKKFRIAGFVKVPAQKGKCKFEILCCALSVLKPDGNWDIDHSGDLDRHKHKVNLYWVGSLVPATTKSE
ncbi:MAG: hypothetical protein HYT93_02655 [Parcubacteria group bacterium]|nr:hypothetical protein [Parcubacteria group bacterium]